MDAAALSRKGIGCTFAAPSKTIETARGSNQFPEIGQALNRQQLMSLSPYLSALLSQNIVVALSPDWMAVCLISEAQWNETGPKYERLAALSEEIRRRQRVQLGSSYLLTPDQPLIIEPWLSGVTSLTGDDLIISVDEVYAELWSPTRIIGPDRLIIGTSD